MLLFVTFSTAKSKFFQNISENGGKIIIRHDARKIVLFEAVNTKENDMNQENDDIIRQNARKSVITEAVNTKENDAEELVTEEVEEIVTGAEDDMNQENEETYVTCIEEDSNYDMENTLVAGETEIVVTKIVADPLSTSTT